MFDSNEWLCGLEVPDVTSRDCKLSVHQQEQQFVSGNEPLAASPCRPERHPPSGGQNVAACLMGALTSFSD